MRHLRCGASRLVLVAAMIGAPVATPAFAQDEQDDTTVDAVVITGSFTATSLEEGVLAVDVFTSEDLEELGSPNITEFTRGLTQSSQAFGEPDVNLAGVASGVVNVNLRGLGGDRTLTLLNGHRTSEDISFIPMNAIGRVEILNDGAGVTYGAGAVAGVINFVTRTDFRGVELSAQQKFIEGSSGGASELSGLFGWGDDHANFLVSVMYAREGELNFTDRDYGQLPFEVNPTQYVTFSAQPGRYIPQTGFTQISDFTPASCSAVGGVMPNGTAECYYYYTPMFNFVDKTENWRFFASGDVDVTDTMNLQFEAGYSRTEVPEVWAAATLPPIPSHRGVVGTGSLCGFSGFFCQYEIPYSYMGVENPFIDEFFQRNLNIADAPATGRVYTGIFWEPFAMNGNPLFPGGARYESRTSERWGAAFRLSGEFSGDGPLSFLEGVTYNYSINGGVTATVLNRRDIVVSRLQNALRGYGGEDCAAVDDTPTDYSTAAAYDATTGIQDADVAPGSGGCQWFNPFASAWRYSVVNGAENPSYGGPAFENPLGLVDWLIEDRPIETTTSDLNIDLLYAGDTARLFSLPGGAPSWAVGAQYRTTRTRDASLASSAVTDLLMQECSYPDPTVATDYVQAPQTPGQFGCDASSVPGAFWGATPAVFRPFSGSQDIYSYFGELRLPLLDSLEAQLAVRHEEYGSIGANTYKVAARWQATDALAFRGSWSTNYAPPPADVANTAPVVGSSYIPRFTTFFPTLLTNIPGIEPEEAVVTNFGVLFETDTFGGAGRFSASVDYFDYDIEGEIVTTSVNTVLTNIVPSGNDLSSPVNCSAGLISFVSFSTGACVQGVTTAGQISQVLTYRTNGPGIQTSGLDLGLNYFTFVGDVDLAVGGVFTLVTDYQVKGYEVNGVPFESGGDFLGFSNVSRAGDFSSELRGNVFASASWGPHNLRGQVNYTQGVMDELGVPAAYPGSTFGIFPKDYYDLDLHYRYAPEWLEGSEFRLSVLNVTDEDPMPAQTRNSYYTGVGNARGRQVEVGVKKSF